MNENTTQKICNCGNQMAQISGNRKSDGKPYSGWKCGQCNAYEPIRQQGSYQGYQKPYQPKPQVDWDAIRHEKSEGLARGAAFKSSVDIVIALFNKGAITEEVMVDKVAELLPKLEAINKNGGKENL